LDHLLEIRMRICNPLHNDNKTKKRNITKHTIKVRPRKWCMRTLKK
jgi:hypothetical protein